MQPEFFSDLIRVQMPPQKLGATGELRKELMLMQQSGSHQHLTDD